MAEALAVRGGPDGAIGLLEEGAGRCAYVAGASERPQASGAAGLRRWMGQPGAGRGSDCGLEGAEPPPWTDAVHDSAGGLGLGAIAIVGPGGGGDRRAKRQPDTFGGGRTDRLLRQHAGAARGLVGVADGGGPSEPGEGRGAGGSGASGPAVRAGG